MGDRPIQAVKSQGAKIGLESFSGAGAFDRRADLSIVAVACKDVDFLPLLGQHQRTFAMDMRGQTIRGSRINTGGITLKEYLKDFDNVRGELGSESLTLFGYSPGGFFTLHYALAHPRRVSALVLAEPAIFTDTEDLIQRARLAEAGDGQRAMEAMLQYIDPSLGKARRRELAAEVVQDWESAEVLGRVFRLHGEHQIRDEHLKKLAAVPTLLFAGTKSPMSFHVKRIAAAVPEASVWWIEGASHLDLVHPPHTEEIAEVTRRFLRRVGAEAPPAKKPKPPAKKPRKPSSRPKGKT